MAVLHPDGELFGPLVESKLEKLKSCFTIREKKIV